MKDWKKLKGIADLYQKIGWGRFPLAWLGLADCQGCSDSFFLVGRGVVN